MSSCDCTVRWNYKTTIKPASLSFIKAYFLWKMVHLLPSSYMYTVVQSGMVSTNIGNGWSDDCRGFSQYLIYSQPIRATWPESTLLSIATQVNIYLLTHTLTPPHTHTHTHSHTHTHTHTHPLTHTLQLSDNNSSCSTLLGGGGGVFWRTIYKTAPDVKGIQTVNLNGKMHPNKDISMVKCIT